MTISITDQQVFESLRTFLLSILPANTEVVQAQDNAVSMPNNGFVSMNNISKIRLETNNHTYTRTTPILGTKDIQDKIQYTMQVDFYGADSGDWAVTAQTIFRDDAGVRLFPVNVVPLYTDDPIQIPLIDGEMNYTQRWKLKTVMQYNPVISVSQQFAEVLTNKSVNIEAEII